MSREPISKKLRFEVFKRDSFTCQYCGRKAPEIILEADHVHPAVEGGKTTLLNLITSCFDCNRGKGKRKLTDKTVLSKQMAQLEELQVRKEQIEMMFNWQKSLLNLKTDTVKHLVDFWQTLTDVELLEPGIAEVKKWAKKYTLEEIISAMKIAADKYTEQESFAKVGGVLHVTRAQKDDPDLAKLYYIRGILRKRFGYFTDTKSWQSLDLMRKALKADYSLDSLTDLAKRSDNWSQWE